MTEEKLKQAAILAERLHEHKRLFDAVNSNPNELLHIVGNRGHVDVVIPMEFYGPLIVAIDKHIRSIKMEVEAL